MDLKGWLGQSGVKLVAVEFYATWCKPCMKVVPKWKALHEKYRARGLRLIVVSVQDQVETAEVSANSHLKATLREGEKPRLILELFSVEDGCLSASAKAPEVGGDLDASVVNAVGQLVRMLAGDVVLPGGPGGRPRYA